VKSGTKQNLLVLTKGNEMAEKLIILDGSMGGELARRGYGKSDGIWSAKAL
jgi:Homocysteine/selenocysteine methylase (S-methylmethionine-dependent)